MTSARMIKCIFLAEFHHELGPIISQQVPEEYVSKEVFDAIHNLIITKPELQNRLITMTAFGNKFVGCPIYIEDGKYKRNALIFNVCFTFDEDTNTAEYSPVVKKLAGYMTQLENELEFLSKPHSESSIRDFLQEVLDDLNHDRCCNIKMAESCNVHLKLAKTIHEPIAVGNHDVPIFSVPKEVVMKHHWDLTTQQMLHYIDGISHVMNIAAEADVELNLVKANLQNLLYYKFLKLVSVFQYSNVYSVTCEINKLMEDSHLQQECTKFVAKSERNPPEFCDVFMLYSQFTPGTTVKDICTRQTNPHNQRVDERKLVQFGVMKGLLRRMHQYPIILPGQPTTSRVQSISKYFDGRNNFDQICCQTGLSHHELEEKIEADASVVIVWR